MSKAELAKVTLSTVLGLFFVNVGIAHFTDTKWFEPIVPEVLGDPTFWVLITGIMEIGLGLGLVIPMTRRYSAMLMAMFLVAVYWANLNMWINDIPIDDNTFEPIWHILRLIGQLLMITVALWVGNWIPKGGVHE
ncbi:MAG: DoxX family protein [Candidatus Poseidoniaceae archaeon]